MHIVTFHVHFGLWVAHSVELVPIIEHDSQVLVPLLQ